MATFNLVASSDTALNQPLNSFGIGGAYSSPTLRAIRRSRGRLRSHLLHRNSRGRGRLRSICFCSALPTCGKRKCRYSRYSLQPLSCLHETVAFCGVVAFCTSTCVLGTETLRRVKPQLGMEDNAGWQQVVTVVF